MTVGRCRSTWLSRVAGAIEFAALSKQCLDRRIGDLATLEKEVLAWAYARNQNEVKINWFFNTPQAWQKLKRHYMKINPENNTIVSSSD